jgi:hypothetical protein
VLAIGVAVCLCSLLMPLLSLPSDRVILFSLHSQSPTPTSPLTLTVGSPLRRRSNINAASVDGRAMIQATLRLPVLLLLLLGLACCVQPALAFTPTLTPRPRQVQLPRSTVAVNTSIADAPGQRIYVIFHVSSP